MIPSPHFFQRQAASYQELILDVQQHQQHASRGVDYRLSHLPSRSCSGTTRMMSRTTARNKLALLGSGIRSLSPTRSPRKHQQRLSSSSPSKRRSWKRLDESIDIFHNTPSSFESSTPVTTNKTHLTKKVVAFSTVHIHEHERIIGDHPACEDGLALAIGWQHGEKSTIMSVDMHERIHNRRQRRSSQKQTMKKLEGYERKALLKFIGGYTEEELMGAFFRHQVRKEVEEKNKRKKRAEKKNKKKDRTVKSSKNKKEMSNKQKQNASKPGDGTRVATSETNKGRTFGLRKERNEEEGQS